MQVGQIVTYREMCNLEEAKSLQRGMNYRLGLEHSVILMSQRWDAPYSDTVEDDGRVLIYEGHDVPRKKGRPDPKSVDQRMASRSGSLTQNGEFFEAAVRHRDEEHSPEVVRVFEKLRKGIWVFNGSFWLKDAWQEPSGGRRVFKFRLQFIEPQPQVGVPIAQEKIGGLEHHRMIPSAVKQEVWKRDHGRCVRCESTDNLHFDHILPFSKGGSSLLASNIQILCARHNLGKGARIE